MIDAVYPDLRSKYMDIDYLREWAILTPTNDIADTINNYVVSLVPGDEKHYLSCDSILKGPNTHDTG
jgi:ATP-dependent DNA helicase PIF1